MIYLIKQLLRRMQSHLFELLFTEFVLPLL